MAEKATSRKWSVTPSEYGIAIGVVLAFGVGLMFQNILAGVLLGFPIGFIAGILYGNVIKK
jgi:hypothetical protein